MTPLVWTVVAVAVLLVVAVLVMYNRFVRQRVLIDESWGQTDVELTRRQLQREAHAQLPGEVAASARPR